MKRVVEWGVVLIAALSITSGALGPCCPPLEDRCPHPAGGRSGDARETASLRAHCAPALPLALTAPCCADERAGARDYGLRVPPHAGTPGLSASSAPALAAAQTGVDAPVRTVPGAPTHRSPILRL